MCVVGREGIRYSGEVGRWNGGERAKMARGASRSCGVAPGETRLPVLFCDREKYVEGIRRSTP